MDLPVHSEVPPPPRPPEVNGEHGRHNCTCMSVARIQRDDATLSNLPACHLFDAASYLHVGREDLVDNVAPHVLEVAAQSG